MSASGGNAVVEHPPHNPKVEGSSPAATPGIGKEKMQEMSDLNIEQTFL